MTSHDESLPRWLWFQRNRAVGNPLVSLLKAGSCSHKGSTLCKWKLSVFSTYTIQAIMASTVAGATQPACRAYNACNRQFNATHYRNCSQWSMRGDRAPLREDPNTIANNGPRMISMPTSMPTPSRFGDYHCEHAMICQNWAGNGSKYDCHNGCWMVPMPTSVPTLLSMLTCNNVPGLSQNRHDAGNSIGPIMVQFWNIMSTEMIWREIITPYLVVFFCKFSRDFGTSRDNYFPSDH